MSKIKIDKVGELIEEVFLKYLWLICSIIAAGLSTAYYQGIIVNVRLTMPNVIMFASIIFVVVGFIFTLIISLQNSPVFERLKDKFPTVTKQMYSLINKVILASIGVVLWAIGVTILPVGIPLLMKLCIAFIGFSFFSYMTLGALYMLKFTTDMVVKNTSMKNKEKIR